MTLEIDDPQLVNATRRILQAATGHDFESQHLEDTPERYLKMLRTLTTPDHEWSFTTFETASDEMVIVSNIPFYTFCAHHILPFHGVAHIAYLPQGRLCGISKLARTVQHFSKGLNVQEELCNTVADYVEEQLDPLGVGVIMKAEHLCMTMRGAQVPGTMTTTSAMRKAFLDPFKGARSEFLQLIKS